MGSSYEGGEDLDGGRVVFRRRLSSGVNVQEVYGRGINESRVRIG